MDTKAQRREAYDRKAHFTHKFQGLYVAKKFPEEIQNLLDVEIPNATLKQLLRFMEKHYKRLTKGQPEVEKALRAVLINRLSKVPEEIRKSQTEKFMKHFEELYPEYEFVQEEPSQYFFRPKDDRYIEKHQTRYYYFEQISMKVPINGYIYIHINGMNRGKPGIGHYTIFHHNPNHRHEKFIASTNELHMNHEYQMNPRSINFQRNVKVLIDKFIQFNQKIQRIQNPKTWDEEMLSKL